MCRSRRQRFHFFETCHRESITTRTVRFPLEDYQPSFTFESVRGGVSQVITIYRALDRNASFPVAYHVVVEHADSSTAWWGRCRSDADAVAQLDFLTGDATT